MTNHHVVIIGGGITGLSAAYAIKQATQNDKHVTCTLLEASDRFGGKIATHREDGLVLELGPDSMLARKPAGSTLIRDLGLDSEVVSMNPQVGKTYIMHHGKLCDMPSGTNMGVPASAQAIWATPLVSFKGKSRAMLDLVLPKGTTSDDDESLGGLLKRRLGDEWVQTVCEPLMAGIYAGKLDDLSVNSTFPQFGEILRKHGSVIRGSKKQLEAARTGALRQPAAKIHGRSAFITLKDGLQTLVEQLYYQLKDWADLRTQSEVARLERTETGYLVHLHGAEEAISADAIVVCTQAFVAGQLLCGLSPTAATLSAIRYGSTATVILGYSGDAVEGFEGSGFLVPRSEKSGITACTWTSNKWPHTSSGGRVLIRCYVGRSGQSDALGLDDTQMAAMVHEELTRLMGIREQPWFTKVTRWDKAMPQPEVGHKSLVQAVEQSLEKDAPGIIIGGAGYHGIGVPDCIQSGKNAASKVLAFMQ